jgi:hypothetical protein
MKIRFTKVNLPVYLFLLIVCSGTLVCSSILFKFLVDVFYFLVYGQPIYFDWASQLNKAVKTGGSGGVVLASCLWVKAKLCQRYTE